MGSETHLRVLQLHEAQEAAACAGLAAAQDAIVAEKDCRLASAAAARDLMSQRAAEARARFSMIVKHENSLQNALVDAEDAVLQLCNLQVTIHSLLS